MCDCVPMCVSLCDFAYVYVCPIVSVSMCLRVCLCLSLCLSVCMSVCLSVCVSVCISPLSTIDSPSCRRTVFLLINSMRFCAKSDQFGKRICQTTVEHAAAAAALRDITIHQSTVVTAP